MYFLSLNDRQFIDTDEVNIQIDRYNITSNNTLDIEADNKCKDKLKIFIDEHMLSPVYLFVLKEDEKVDTYKIIKRVDESEHDTKYVLTVGIESYTLDARVICTKCKYNYTLMG